MVMRPRWVVQVAGDRPEVPFLCASAARIEHRRHRLVDRDLGRAQNEFPQPKIQRLELRGRIAHPECQRRAFDRDALAQQHLGLAIERQMPSIFGNQDRGHHRLGRQPALDQPFRRWCLDHALFAGPAGVLGTMRHDHPILGGDDVETLGGVLPDDVHCAMTAWTRGNLGYECDVDAGKMGRQRSAVGAPFLPLGIGRGFRRVFLVLLRILLGDRRLDILQR